MNCRSLKGPWRLSYRRPGGRRQEVPVSASVPGNVELDLSRGGLLPEDLFFGENILSVREWEDVEWWYETEFTAGADELESGLELMFHGVDGDAEYLVNGRSLGTSANALIEHRFSVAGAVREGRNELSVHLRPLRPPGEADQLVPLWAVDEPLRQESNWVRKPAHAYGWDIMPRALSAGIWRPVELVAHDGPEISRFYPAVVEASDTRAELRFYYEVRGLSPGTRYELTVEGGCGRSSFTVSGQVVGRTGAIKGSVPSPRLWWPRGYGDPNLYDVWTQLKGDGVVAAQRHDRIGIRTVELVRKATTPAERGVFQFLVNGVPVYCRGTNWVPLDAFHSRDSEWLDSRLSLLWRSNSNMVRWWGGNVYPPAEFLDWCDEHGVMVWQDFAFACAMYPQTTSFADVVREEVTSVVRRLRHHPSVVLWCGDNECDTIALRRGVSPNTNLLTRQVIPEVVHAEDPHRPYVPSSPYVDRESEEALIPGDFRALPETHLWGPRNYYKSDFYRGASAAFVGEIGFMGLPHVESMRRFIAEGELWPHENRQWLVHGTDPTVDFTSRFWWRTVMALECVRTFFGEMPGDLCDVVIASQLVQAEGFKYAIESGRQAKWERTGVLWWSLFDGWPQISDGVVDWYLGEKLAFEIIARSQRPLLVMVGDPSGTRYPVLACNDTRRDASGRFRIARIDGEVIAAGDYASPANQTVHIAELELADTRTMLEVSWDDDDGEASNHYLLGSPPFDLAQLRQWYERVLGRHL